MLGTKIVKFILATTTTTATSTTTSCPMRDTSCMDDEESNVIHSVTTLDDAECASECK